jgi:N-acylneuraminate cytidylyltransferase
MKTVCFIPIKSKSERVKGKNFKKIGGEKLYKIIINKAIKSLCFDDVIVDTNSDEIGNYAKSVGALVIKRLPELALNSANGNDLINYHHMLKPNYDYYFQLFATAPLIKVRTIRECVNKLLTTTQYDSAFTALEQYGFFWWSGQPVNYRPAILPRSQDLVPVLEETTGLYGITKQALEKYNSRIGAKPYLVKVGKTESIDLNIDDDFHYANWLVEKGISSIIE